MLPAESRCCSVLVEGTTDLGKTGGGSQRGAGEDTESGGEDGDGEYRVYICTARGPDGGVQGRGVGGLQGGTEMRDSQDENHQRGEGVRFEVNLSWYGFQDENFCVKKNPSLRVLHSLKHLATCSL